MEFFLHKIGALAFGAMFYASSAWAGNFDMVNYDIQGSRSLKGGSSGMLSKKSVEARGLEVKWFAPTDLNAFVAPLIHDNVLYIGTTDLFLAGNKGTVYALNATTGAELWSNPIGGVQATPVIAGDYLWVIDQVGGLHKLDRATGDLQCTFRPRVSFNLIGIDRDGSFAGLAAIKDMILMVINPRDEALTSPTRFGVSALLAVDNECQEIWRHYPGIPVQEGGSGIWGQPVYSHKLNQVFFSTGQTTGLAPNALPTGSDSIHAVDADTGEEIWQTQVRPKDPSDVANADIWNFSIPFDPTAPIDTDIGDGPALFKEAGGKEYVAAGSKRGFFYVLDAESGEIQNPGAEDPVYHSGLDLFAELGLGDAASGVVGPGIDGGINFDSGYYRKGSHGIHFGILSDYTANMIQVANQECADPVNKPNQCWNGTIPSGVANVPDAPAGSCFAANQGLSPTCPPADGAYLWLADEMGTELLGSYFEDNFFLFSPLYFDDMILLYAAASTTQPPAANKLVVVDVSDPMDPELIVDVPLEKDALKAVSGGAILTVGNGLIYAGAGRGTPVNGLFAIGLK